MRTFIKIIVILILTSCQIKTKENNGNNKDSIKTIDTEMAQPTDGPIEAVDDKKITKETFMDFFENFMWNSDFQNERIVFPINYQGKQLISQQDWEYNRFYTVKSYMPILHTDTISYFDKDVSDSLLKMSIVSFINRETENYSFRKTCGIWKLVSVETQPIDSLNDMDFVDFIKQFSSDSLYQKEHVVFPIPNYHVDYDNDYETLYDSIKSDNWRFIQLENDLESIMTLNENVGSDYRLIFFRGIENGIHVKYTFRKIGNDWKLIKLEDYST